MISLQRLIGHLACDSFLALTQRRLLTGIATHILSKKPFSSNELDIFFMFSFRLKEDIPWDVNSIKNSAKVIATSTVMEGNIDYLKSGIIIWYLEIFFLLVHLIC